MDKVINIVGGGLAGCECAYFLAEHGFNVKLYEMKPIKFSPAHHKETLAEIVCSNSFKNEGKTTSSGLLKAEMKELGSVILKVAEEVRVPSGGALAVDREKFTEKMDKLIKSHKNIQVIEQEIQEIDPSTKDIWVIATGPLTSEPLMRSICRLIGEDSLYFFDASAPIVTKESLDFNKCFYQNRYGECGKGDYVNCPLTKQEYDIFYNELINADKVILKDFEKNIFEGCMPIEVIASRGKDSLRFGPLKPVGFNNNPLAIKPYAIVQLRKENLIEESFNIVGFQTNLKFGEQKRVFSLIPALKNAEFIKYGVMHKNCFINAPSHLNSDFSLRNNPNIYFAGQISGVEGYMESTASGLVVAISILMRYNNSRLQLTNESMIGAISSYISNSANANNFQPMNSNYGIIKELTETIKDKEQKRLLIYDRAINQIKQIKEKINEY